jgi:hypothetical protein
VPALRRDQRRDALAIPVPAGLAPVALGEAIDVGEALVVPELDNSAEDRDRVIPVLEIEHGDGHTRIAAHVAEPQALEVHVDEQTAVVPVVPCGRRVWGTVRAHCGYHGGLWRLQEFDELGRKRGRWHATSLGRRAERGDATTPRLRSSTATDDRDQPRREHLVAE